MCISNDVRACGTCTDVYNLTSVQTMGQMIKLLLLLLLLLADDIACDYTSTSQNV